MSRYAGVKEHRIMPGYAGVKEHRIMPGYTDVEGARNIQRNKLSPKAPKLFIKPETYRGHGGP
ncbi:MAG: hypothetical protein KAT70_02350 [Thermoplasmata archaeon]|nr:hypothetical protein [Thermoplasmata archaeon]